MSSSSGWLPTTGATDPEFEQKLLVYYQHLFPFHLLYKWLSYGSREQFHCREFAFWLLPSSASMGPSSLGGSNNHASSNLFVRYQCYESEEQFRKALTTRETRFEELTIVERMEIGPIYTTPPSQHAQSGCVPRSREFVIDIDMDDYNSVRNCCQGASVCSSCWLLMTVAVKVIDELLRRQFAFQNLLWVFSGRRGVHCWVSDDAARNLHQQERAAIIENMSLVTKAGVEITDPLLPFYGEIYDKVLLRYFESRILIEQNLLHHDSSRTMILEHLPSAVASALDATWLAEPERDSAYRWDQLKKTLLKAKDPEYRRRIATIVFLFTYPRFDVKVSEDLNHLLKSPFCVHPKTGFVSVPIDPENCEKFDPTKHAPSLTALVESVSTREENNDRLLFQQAEKLFTRKFLRPLLLSQQASKQRSGPDLEDLATTVSTKSST